MTRIVNEKPVLWGRWWGTGVALLVATAGCAAEPLDAAPGDEASEPVAAVEKGIIQQPRVCQSAPLPPHAHVRQDVVASYPNGGFYDLAVYASDGGSFSDYQNWLPVGLSRAQEEAEVW